MSKRIYLVGGSKGEPGGRGVLACGAQTLSGALVVQAGAVQRLRSGGLRSST
jgi:hypothetical protein